jgi:hypothetical protein
MTCPWAKSHDGAIWLKHFNASLWLQATNGVIWLKHFNASHWVKVMMESFG